jgi:predicted transcriptional regulator
VAPAHQYRGLANAAYDVIEGHHGQPLVGSRDPSPQGQALWRARAKSTARIFDAGREHAAGLAGQQAGRLITHVTEEVRTTLRTIIASGVAANDSPQTIARRLKAWVSLTPAQVKSTVAYAGELVDMGHSFPRVQALVQRYVTKKKLIRAEAIAAYESMHAVNRGVISAAKQAQADGRLGWRATKEWRSRQDPIVCKRCKALHGVRIPLDSVFPDGAGAGPPRHGYCRCWLVIHEEA